MKITATLAAGGQDDRVERQVALRPGDWPAVPSKQRSLDFAED